MNSRSGVKILLPLETGTIRGHPRDAGIAGKPVVRAGTWHRRAACGAGEAGQPADLVRRGRQGPLHLIHEGGLAAFCPTAGLAPGRHAGHDANLAGSCGDIRPAAASRWFRSASPASSRRRRPRRRWPPATAGTRAGAEDEPCHARPGQTRPGVTSETMTMLPRQPPGSIMVPPVASEFSSYAADIARKQRPDTA